MTGQGEREYEKAGVGDYVCADSGLNPSENPTDTWLLDASTNVSGCVGTCESVMDRYLFATYVWVWKINRTMSLPGLAQR